MNKTAITWLSIAACLVIIGAAVFGLTMAANRWDLSLLSNEKTETNTYDISESFRGIAIDSDTAEIEFRPSDDGKCSVVCCEREKEKHSVSVQNGTLTIELIDTRKWFDHISLFSFGSPTITVYLPQAEYADLSIEESTGNITIPEGFLFGSVDIDLSTGDVDCRASASGRIRIETSTGDIHAEGLSAGELDLTVSTGHVDIRSAACEGNVGISVSTGKAYLTDVECGSIRSAGSTGDITLENVIASETISIERSTGDVSFERCDAAGLTIETGTGKVTGALLSDKVFIAHSDTGRVEVPETVTGGTCRITTDTGDIRITIENE